LHEETDPDTLQLLDELNGVWAKRWRNISNEHEELSNDLTFIVMPEEEGKESVPTKNSSGKKIINSR
jgi:hypothetical protein